LGCKKDEPSSCQETGNENCEDIQNVKNFFYFKVGSYWVYEEETSGDLDTVYVTEASENPSNYDFDVRVYSTYQDYYYHFFPQAVSGLNGCLTNGNICKWCASIMRSKYKPGDFVGEAKCFFFIPKVGATDVNWNSQFSNNYIIVNQIDNSFVNEGFIFDRTIKMNELNTQMEDFQETNHYFSENVGLVRKELLDSNKVWNLVNYCIQP
jgi:hypothetical protein